MKLEMNQKFIEAQLAKGCVVCLGKGAQVMHWRPGKNDMIIMNRDNEPGKKWGLVYTVCQAHSGKHLQKSIQKKLRDDYRVD